MSNIARVCWTSEVMEHVHCGEWMPLGLATTQVEYLNGLFTLVVYWVERVV